MPKKNPATGDPILDTLKAERERRGLSQTELARTIGRSTYQTTYQWESGASSPTLRSLREWAASLGYDVTLTPAPGRPLDVYCFCADCIRCGCGMWERHHADVRDVTPAPGRSGEEKP